MSNATLGGARKVAWLKYSRKARRRRPVAVLLVFCAVFGALMLLESAGASTTSVVDPAGDNLPALDPRGDVVLVAASYETSGLVMTATTAQFDDPETSANWSAHGSGVVFNVDTNSDQEADYFVSYMNGGFGPYAVVVSSVGSLVCGADPSWEASNRTYSVTVASTCIGDPSDVAVSASFQYSTAAAASYDETAFTPNGSPTTTTATTVTTSTTVSEVPTTTTTTTVAPSCKPGYGWGDKNHLRCPAPLSKGKDR
jgi:hypothetical protein